MRLLHYALALRAWPLVVVMLFLSACGEVPGDSRAEDFAQAGREAAATLAGVYYSGPGRWRACDVTGCAIGDADWGDDSLTYALALRVSQGHDRQLVPMLRALASNAPAYAVPCARVSGCGGWSDVPEWDSIALSDEYLATGAPVALVKARNAFAYVQRTRVFSGGGCPAIPYQQPGGGENRLKTLETAANAVKAALLLYQATRERSYLISAIGEYRAARTYFLDPQVPLYTVYVFDDGQACRQVPHRFYASVNGDMIWSGVALYRDTGRRTYRDQAISTAAAVERYLSDGRGVFTDLQAENDVVEPLIEGMLALAQDGQRAARAWVLANAAAALSSRTHDGSFGRFFDGPPPATTVTAWQTNGGLAAEIAASAIAPHTQLRTTDQWTNATLVPHQIVAFPATISFHGSGIALFGTLGERCCEAGHARVLIDGRETVDRTGIWQNKSSAGRSIPNTVLFTWRWHTAGNHTLTFLPGLTNPKEGGSYLQSA
ncbi:MAG: hypothetical protein ACXVFQ_23155, partial [Solirubrobacteraceae bacterium]